VLDGLLDQVVAHLSATESVSLDPVALHGRLRSLARLGVTAEGWRLDHIAALHGGGSFDVDGSATAARWLDRNTRHDISRTRRDVHTARNLAACPGVAAALKAAAISEDHAAVLARYAKVDPVAFSDIEDTLVELAGSYSRREMRPLLDMWKTQVISDEDAEKTFRRLHENRGVQIAADLDGTVVLRGTFDPLDGAEIRSIIADVAQVLWEQDQAVRKAMIASGEAAPSDLRSDDQRRADALLVLLRERRNSLTGTDPSSTHGDTGRSDAESEAPCRESSDTGESSDTDESASGTADADRCGNHDTAHDTFFDGGPATGPDPWAAERAKFRVYPPRAAITLIMGLGDVAAARAHHHDQHHNGPAALATLDGTPILLPATAIDRVLCDCALRPAITDSFDVVLELGRTHRLASAPQRDALAVRDRGCVFPGCAAAPSLCTAHHIAPWHPKAQERGGLTDTDNMALLCRHHHSKIHHHHPEWSIHMGPERYPIISRFGINQPRNRRPLRRQDLPPPG